MEGTMERNHQGGYQHAKIKGHKLIDIRIQIKANVAITTNIKEMRHKIVLLRSTIKTKIKEGSKEEEMNQHLEQPGKVQNDSMQLLIQLQQDQTLQFQKMSNNFSKMVATMEKGTLPAQAVPNPNALFDGRYVPSGLIISVLENSHICSNMNICILVLFYISSHT